MATTKVNSECTIQYFCSDKIYGALTEAINKWFAQIFLFAVIILGIPFRKIFASVRSLVSRLHLPYCVQSHELNSRGLFDESIPDNNFKVHSGSTVVLAGYLRVFCPPVCIRTSAVTLIDFLVSLHNAIASVAHWLRAVGIGVCGVGSNLWKLHVFVSKPLVRLVEIIFFAEQTQQRLVRVYSVIAKFCAIIGTGCFFFGNTIAVCIDNALTGSNRKARTLNLFPINAVGEVNSSDETEMLFDTGAAMNTTNTKAAPLLNILWRAATGLARAVLANGSIIDAIGQGEFRCGDIIATFFVFTESALGR